MQLRPVIETSHSKTNHRFPGTTNFAIITSDINIITKWANILNEITELKRFHEVI